MAMHDSAGKKIGRNSKCPCGSGKKYKYCHGSLSKCRTRTVKSGIPDEALEKIKEVNLQRYKFESTYGKGKQIISAEFKDYRFTAVGNELHYAKKDTAKYFTDFLCNYIRAELGTKWGNSELKKSLEDRHQLLKWYDSMCHFQAKQTPQDDGTYEIKVNGSMLSWYRVAYDLYLIKHNAELKDKLLNRLKNKEQFQGARFELCSIASMIVSGFDINFENEDDTTRKHPEFLARNKSGLEIAVEAKSRHRNGILEYKAPPRRTGNNDSPRVAVDGLIRKALNKNPGKPYFIFIDPNLPYGDENPHGNPWVKEMAETVEELLKEYKPSTFPANAIFFCNDPTYQDQEALSPGLSFWCYCVPIEKPKYPLPDPNLVTHIAQSIIKRTNIPKKYPKK